MTRTIIDLHVLQTVPPSNLNRDDTGSPKTAVYGGVRRARVSSQAWKRATRTAFKPLMDRSDLGLRTRQVVEMLGARIGQANPALAAEAESLAKTVLERAGFKLKPARKKGAPDEAEFLLFLSERQIAALADAAVQAAAAGGDLKTALAEYDLKGLADQEHSIDIALFGRMVANLPELNVDAAVQVAHAISVHAVDNEFDYFTAVDDHKSVDDEEDSGAGMIGTVEFNSATLYRYATLDVDRLLDNLGDAEATRRAVTAFVRAFLTSMPTGKQNTFAHRTLPDAVLVTLGSSQPANLVGAFENPITGLDRPDQAARLLADHAGEVFTTYSLAHDKTWVVGVGKAGTALAEHGSRVSIDELVEQVAAAAAERLSVPA